MWSQPPATSKVPELGPSAPSEVSRESDVNFLRKGRGYNRTRNGRSLKTKTRENVKFRPLDDGDSTDSDTEAGHVFKGDARHVNLHPWLPGAGSTSTASTRSSTPTVFGECVLSPVDDGKDSCQAIITPARLSTSPEVSDLPDYSDHEVDVTLDVNPTRHDPEWTPRFFLTKALPKPQPDNPSTTPPLDQFPFRTGRRGPSQENPRNPPERHGNPRWQAFWRDVDEKIQHEETS